VRSRLNGSGTPTLGGLNARGVAKYSDFGAFGGHVLETVQDRKSYMGF